MTKSLQSIADMETPTNFRQDYYTTMNKGYKNMVNKLKSRLNILPDMKNVQSKANAARVIFLAQVNFWSEYRRFCREWRKYYPVCFTKL